MKRVKVQSNKPMRVLKLIIDIILVIILIVVLAIAVNMLIAKAQSEVPEIFGYSVVKILSGSMVASGFNKGDMAVLDRNNYKLEVGSIIAYYNYVDPSNPKPNLIKEGTAGYSEKAMKKSSIIFHEIVQIITDDQGVEWYRTKGSSNSHTDAMYVRSDVVLGEYASVSPAVKGILSFINSPIGMVSIALIPTGIILFINCIYLINMISARIMEKKVLKGKLDLEDIICRRHHIGINMLPCEKDFLMRNVDYSKIDIYEKILYNCETFSTRPGINT